MSRKTNIISYIITMAATLISLFFVVYVCNNVYGGQMITAILRFAVGAIAAGLIHAFAHETGHLVSGKKNGFVFSSMTVWFFRWRRVNKKIRFDFVMMGEEAGYTEMIPSNSDNLERRLKRMTAGGERASLIFMLLGVPPLFMSFLSVWIYSVWAMLLPVGAYYFFGSLMPSSSNGVRNDGGIIYGLKKNDDVSKVIVGMLSVQAQMYLGKTPSEVDESLYFDLPQLPEDSPYFAMLLNLRYNYYLDKGDYENAKTVSDRLLSLDEYLPKEYILIAKTDALYNACTFDYDEDVADDLTYELEKYLNNVNSSTNVRAKLAYFLYVKRETENLDLFFKKGYKEANRCLIKGLGDFEKKLFERMNDDYLKIANS